MNAKQNNYFVMNGNFRMQDWLLKADLSQGAKLTYSVLACCAGGRDHAWPSQEFLAEKVSASIRSVQRYLRELVESGFIEKCRGYIKGKVRCFYKFLSSASISSSAPRLGEQSVNLSCCSLGGEKTSQSNTTNCRVQCDKLSPSLNKEESNKGKEILPPTPRMDDLCREAVEPIISVSGKEGEFLSGAQENPCWTEAKNILAATHSEKEIKTWIEPLIFESSHDGTILRCPNNFFRNWLGKNFKEALIKALAEVGIDDWSLELQTDEQLAAKQKIEIGNEVPKKINQLPVVDMSSLSIEEQYAAFYSAYPKPEKYDDGFKNFQRLARRNELPPVAELIKIVKRQYSNNLSWQLKDGRYIPQIHNWLLGKRWKD